MPSLPQPLLLPDHPDMAEKFVGAIKKTFCYPCVESDLAHQHKKRDNRESVIRQGIKKIFAISPWQLSH
jgi:hypothetical protein